MSCRTGFQVSLGTQTNLAAAIHGTSAPLDPDILHLSGFPPATKALSRASDYQKDQILAFKASGLR